MDNNYEMLIKILKEKKKICIAFSGGVDSTFLLKAAKEALDKNILAITIVSSMNPKREIKESVEFCKEIGVKHILIDADEYSIPEFVANDKERCYFCKKEIFTKIKEKAKNEGFDIVADGSNIDDNSDYRPGMKALKELGIVSPLKEANLSKNEIRKICKEINLSVWNKPSMACLASRIPYGTAISRDKLEKVELAEEILLNKGFKQFRVRYYDNLAKIEVLKKDINKIIAITATITTHIFFTNIFFLLQSYIEFIHLLALIN